MSQVGFYRNHENVLCVDGNDLGQIAKTHGTPTYVYSLPHILSQYDTLFHAVTKETPPEKAPLLCYACKANSHTAILRALKNRGSGLEVVSGGELQRGLKAGFDPSKIVFTGVGKQPHEIRLGLEVGIGQFNVESVEELTHLSREAADMGKDVPLVFRVNPDIAGGGHHKISTGRARDKFGIGMDRIAEAYQRALALPNLKPLGLSFHIGSQVFEVEAFRKTFERISALVTDLRAQGFPVTVLDIGGGFPIRYKDEGKLDLEAYAAWARDLIQPLDVKIIMEPGRFLVGNAGGLLSRVISVKETRDGDFLILDAAMNDLIRPTLYEAYHEVLPVRALEGKEELVTYTIVGPICESGDTFAYGREMSAVQEGDLVLIASAGAYGFCMASNYNTRGLPAEILADTGKFSLIRDRQSVEDLYQNEYIPEWDALI